MNLGGLGPAALGVSLAGAGAAAALAWRGRTRPAARFLVLAFAGLSVGVVALAVALVTVDGSLVYVADHTSRATRWPYRLAALWGGMAGSLLVWTWMAAGWAVVAGRAVRRRAPALVRGVQGVMAGYVVVFCALLVAVSEPFEELAVPAIDGGGLNPVLLHPAMLYHPPLLYAGAVGLAVPFALAMAALVGRQAGWSWVPLATRWAGVSLVLLTAGLLAGAHWAYVELGWGGYWAWDPVENGGLLPWLAAVAFLHAGVVARRRGGPATGAAALAALAFVLGLLGSFLTRSGATESVHAFAEATAVGWVLGAALVASVVVAVVLVVRDRRRSPARPSPRLLSGKGAVAANNALLVGLVVVIGFGALYPVVAAWATGESVVVTGRYFTLAATPLAVALLALIGVGPRLGWRATPTAEVARRLRPAVLGVGAAAVAGAWFTERRPVAIAIVGLAAASAALTVSEWRRRGRGTWPLAHVGVAVLLAGVAGTTTGASVITSLEPDDQVTVREYTLRLVDVVPVAVPHGGRAAQARLELLRGDRSLGTLGPEALVSATGQRVSVAALRSTPLTDVQVALRAVGDGGEAVVVEVGVLPLLQLVWWGGLLIVAGLALGVLRPRRREQPPAPAPAVRTPERVVELVGPGV